MVSRVNQRRGGSIFAASQLHLGPDATLNTETHKNSVRIKAPNSVNASKHKHKNQVNHYNKKRQVLMANSEYARVNNPYSSHCGPSCNTICVVSEMLF